MTNLNNNKTGEQFKQELDELFSEVNWDIFDGKPIASSLEQKAQLIPPASSFNSTEDYLDRLFDLD